MTHPMWPACCGRFEKDCDCPYQHDIDDLLQVIRQLELRIIELEKSMDGGVTHIPPDGWYFEY